MKEMKRYCEICGSQLYEKYQKGFKIWRCQKCKLSIVIGGGEKA